MNPTRTLLALLVFLVASVVAIAAEPAASVTTVSTLAELAQAAGQTGQKFRIKPGVYQLTDLIPLSAAAERRKSNQFELFVFNGSNNVFDFEGVTIEVDTELRRALRPPIHTSEFVVAGSSNTIQGLTISHRGDGTSLGGAALAVTGEGNTLRNCTIHVRGSFPYGYGDLFGKGGDDVIPPRKKSGILVTGHGTTLLGCKLHMHSFGHGFFIQKDAENVRFEDCSVEGVMRPTDEILAETSGPAFEVGFRSVVKNREGVNRVSPGYMKSLSEDGFRTYGQHKNLSFKNCTARNMRGGFELRTKAGVRLENCSAFGNERGFWVSDNAQVVNCRGDAQYGPLLFVEGNNALVHIEFTPAASHMKVHALASIQGQANKVTISPSAEGARSKALPILVGYGVPMMGDGMANIPERNARDLTLRNETTMPVVIGAKASGGEIISRGPVQENRGKQVTVKGV